MLGCEFSRANGSNDAKVIEGEATPSLRAPTAVKPKVFEAIGRHFGVAHRVLDVFVPQGSAARPRVSWPSLASLNPQAWRSMWGWIGNGILAASPTRWIRRWKPMGLIGPPRSETNT